MILDGLKFSVQAVEFYSWFFPCSHQSIEKEKVFCIFVFFFFAILVHYETANILEEQLKKADILLEEMDSLPMPGEPVAVPWSKFQNVSFPYVWRNVIL